MAKKRPRSDNDDFEDFPLDPKPRTSLLTVALCFFNGLAAFAFIYLMVLDVQKRHAWKEACFKLDMYIKGQPLEDEEKGPSGVYETDSKPNWSSEDLKASHHDRKLGLVKEPFIATEQLPAPRILPSDLNNEKLAAIFGDIPQPVATLEAEVRRVKGIIIQDINAAAIAAAKAETTPADKRKKLENVLLPQAIDSFQIAELNKLIRATDDARLDELLIKAFERRMLLDILKPVEYHRPGNRKLPYLDLEKASSISDLKVKELQDKLILRLDNAASDKFSGELYLVEKLNGQTRDAIAKHANISFLIFAIAHVNKPDGKPLYERGAERTQILVGLYAFAAAARQFTEALEFFTNRLLEQIQHDREGIVIVRNQDQPNEKVMRTPAFTVRYAEIIQGLRELVNEIDRAKVFLERMQKQSELAKKTYEEGVKDVAARKAELLAERAKTAKLYRDLQAVQARLFQYRLELGDAGRINEELARAIREIEQEQARIEGMLPAKGKSP